MASDDATAYRQFSTSVDAFDRARELASEGPPGDPDAIATERDDLLAKLDDLDVRTPVMTAEDEQISARERSPVGDPFRIRVGRKTVVVAT